MDQEPSQEIQKAEASLGAMSSPTQAGSPSVPRTSIPPSPTQRNDCVSQSNTAPSSPLESVSPHSARQQDVAAQLATVPSTDRVSFSTVSSSPPTGAPSAAPNDDDEQIVFTKRAIPQPRQQSPSPAYPTSAPSAKSTFGGPSESSSAEPRRSLDGPSSSAAAGATPSSPSLSRPSSVTPSESWEVPSQPASLLSQILSTHAHKLSLIHSGPGTGGGGPHSAGPASPLSSVPNSTASSPVGSTAQLHGIFRRRGSDGASDLLGSGLSRVGEEDVLGAATRAHGRTELSTTSSSRYPSPERSTSPSEIAVSLDGGLPSVEPALAPPLLVDPTVRTLPQDHAPMIVRSIIASGPPSSVVTANALVPPVRKASNLTFAVTTVCARPEAMGALPGPDRKLHESESDEDDDEDAEEEEDDDDDDQDEEDDGYCEDDEGDATTDTDDEDEDGDELDASPAERKRYRYKRHSLFGESDSNEESPSDADADSTHQAGKRDSVLSNFSVGGGGPEPAEPTLARKASLSRSTSLLRHRRSLSLKGKSARKAASDSIPPVPPVPTLRFPTPLVARQDHSDFPRSPVPASTVRGGGGYSPRVRQGVRVGAVSSGGEKSASRPGAVIGRDDFLPTHLKSEDGKNKERDRDRDRDRDSTTDAGGASGRCSRHRSPPPSSAGRDKMREHHARQRSRSAALSGEDRSGPSRRGSADPGAAQVATAASRPPPILPPPILLRSATGLPTPRGDLTPVFFSEAEEVGSSRTSPPLSPTAPARAPPHPHFQIPTHPHPPASARPFPLATPPPSRRVSSSLSERRASLSVVCSAFRRPSDDLALAADPVMSTPQATLALDGTPSTPFSATQGAGLLTQSLQKALGTTSVPPPPSPATATAIRPFSPPPSAPSSFGPHRFSLDPPTQPGGSRRRMSQPTATDERAGERPVKARPIACPRRLSSGQWTDGG